MGGHCVECAGVCSHTRSEHYFINSIREPLLFGSKTCATVEDCNNQIESGTEVRNSNGAVLQ